MKFCWMLQEANQKPRKAIDNIRINLKKKIMFTAVYCIFWPHFNLAINYFGGFVLAKTNIDVSFLCLSSYWS